MEANTNDKVTQKEGIAGKLTYVGGGVGLGLFAIFGIVNASFVGGVIGLNLAGLIGGFPVDSSILSRIIVVIGMLTGVMVAGLIFIMAGAIAGWIAGKAVDMISAPAASKEDKAKVSH